MKDSIMIFVKKMVERIMQEEPEKYAQKMYIIMYRDVQYFYSKNLPLGLKKCTKQIQYS